MSARDSAIMHLVPDGLESLQAHDESYRKNALYVAAMEIVSEAVKERELFEPARGALKQALETIVSKKRPRSESQLLTVPDDYDTQDCLSALLIRPPDRMNPRGRPATLRPKSRMDYVAAKKRKEAARQALSHAEAADELSPVDMQPERPIFSKTRERRCGRCRKLGHNRSRCNARGV